MRKSFLLMVLLIASAIISGCAGNQSNSDSNTLALPDENGKEVSFENMEKPPLVFFFTGVG